MERFSTPSFPQEATSLVFVWPRCLGVNRLRNPSGGGGYSLKCYPGIAKLRACGTCSSLSTVHGGVLSHTRGAIFQARLLDNQEGCQYRTMRLRKALGEMLLTPTVFWHRHYYSNGGEIERGKSAQRGGTGIHFAAEMHLPTNPAARAVWCCRCHCDRHLGGGILLSLYRDEVKSQRDKVVLGLLACGAGDVPGTTAPRVCVCVFFIFPVSVASRMDLQQ